MALLCIYEELTTLLTENKKLLEEDKYLGCTVPQNYFCVLEEKYCTARYRRASFEKATGLSRSAYEDLNGVKECKTIAVKNVIYAAYWLGVTYKEGKLLYLLWFNNQIKNEVEYQFWNEKLKLLDDKREQLMKMTDIQRVMFIKEEIKK